MSEVLSTTEATTIDLVSLRNWHFQASMDKGRSPQMRRWHRGQAQIIGRKIPHHGPGSLSPMKVALVEFLSVRYRKVVEARACRLFAQSEAVQETALAFEWQQYCRAQAKRIVDASLRAPSNSRSTSSECDSEGKAAGDSPEDAAASKTSPSGATA